MYARARFSTEATSSKITKVESQKEKIPFRSEFFPIESLTSQELEKLNSEGMKTVKTFNEKLRQAKEKASISKKN
jgi:hypothetical protein